MNGMGRWATQSLGYIYDLTTLPTNYEAMAHTMIKMFCHQLEAEIGRLPTENLRWPLEKVFQDETKQKKNLQWARESNICFQ